MSGSPNRATPSGNVDAEREIVITTKPTATVELFATDTGQPIMTTAESVTLAPDPMIGAVLGSVRLDMASRSPGAPALEAVGGA